MRLAPITEHLWVNPERVVSVEERTIDNGRGIHTFVELTMESSARWKLDMPLAQVVARVNRAETYE